MKTLAQTEKTKANTPTPGPWEAIEWSCHAATTVVTEHEGHRILIAECSGGGRSAAESVVDARLIAAAPELLEALEDIVEQSERTNMALPPDLADSIRVFGKAAIRKAKGEL
jgi:hypothetical protein